jgi:hypothetical protein
MLWHRVISGRHLWAALAATCGLVAPAGLAPVPAGAAAMVKLRAAFVPDHLGASTTVRFGFDVLNRPGSGASPVTSVNIHLPAGINENASELGLATCEPAALAALGPAACPVNSQLGFGTAGVEVAFGGGSIQEAASVSTFAGPPKTASELLFYIEGTQPILARLMYSGHVRAESGVFGSVLETTIPLVPTVPGGNYVTMTRFESTLGPLGLTYRKRVNGRLVSFHPQGVAIPARCPAGGFPFLAELHFADGSQALARTAVPCPPRSHGHSATAPAG